MELNKVQDRTLNIEHRKSKPKLQQNFEQPENVATPSNPDFYRSYKGVAFKGHPYINDVKDTERTKNIKLDDENFTVKSYKKGDNEFILTDCGKLYRVKYSKNKDKNAETVLASRLYNLAGVKTPEMKVFESEHGMNGYASEYVSNLDSMESNPQALYQAFGADAWLGNWNTFSHNNTGIDSDGNPVKIITSGSLSYRASGKKKDKFDKDVDELKTMRDSATNPKGAELLKNMPDEDLQASLKKVADIKKNDIILAVKQSQIEDKQNMIDTLLARQEFIKSELDKLTPSRTSDVGTGDPTQSFTPPSQTSDSEAKDSTQTFTPSFTDAWAWHIDFRKAEKVTPEIRARRKEQLNKYLNGDYIYINKDNPNDWYTNFQKENIAKVRRELEYSPEKRESFEDVLDVCFWEYQGRRDLQYTNDLHKFVNYPADRLKTIAHLATFKESGYTRPINEPDSYNKLDDIPTDKLNYMVYKCHLKTVDALLEMNKSSFDSMKTSMDLGAKYGINDSLVNNIIKFASDETGNIPKYKQDAMEILLQKNDEFKKPYGSYSGGGPTCLLSSVMQLCDSKEKTDYILNTVLPMYDKIVPKYDQNSQYDIANLSKENADKDFEIERINLLRNSSDIYSYWDMLNHISNQEKLDIYKDCIASGMNNHYALETLFHSYHYDTDTKETHYDYDSINFAKSMYKDNLQNVGIFQDYLINFNYNNDRRQEILDDVQKIKERGLVDLKLSDRMPPNDTSYWPNPNTQRNLREEEVALLKDVPLEKMKKVKKYLEIPERDKYNQFPIDQIITLLDIDEKSGNKIERYNLFNSRLSAEQIMILADMNDSTLSEMEKRGISKKFPIKRDTASYGEVASYFDKLDKSGWDRAEERFFKNDKVLKNIGRNVTFEQYKSLMSLDDKKFNHIMDEDMFAKHGVDNTLQYVDLAEYENISSINELSSAQKRTLLKKFVKYNKSMFTNPALNSEIIPKNQNEYCSTMQNLVNSIGLRYKPISNDTKEQYFKTLENLENLHGEFMNIDLTREGAELELSYPRKDFLQDIEKYLNGLSEKDRTQVTNYFGFEYREYKDGSRKMNGYPVDNDSDLSTGDYNYATRKAIDYQTLCKKVQRIQRDCSKSYDFTFTCKRTQQHYACFP